MNVPPTRCNDNRLDEVQQQPSGKGERMDLHPLGMQFIGYVSSEEGPREADDIFCNHRHAHSDEESAINSPSDRRVSKD
jgi:hypothetical protein